MKRWVCPRCGTGQLAPAAMRRDDTRGYCLGCSGSTGKLVQRICPAREQQAVLREIPAPEKEG